jgi:pimeloyl-ACP methyl ester carboxylesterase
MADWSHVTAPNGQHFVYAESGDGPPVVFLHGFPDTPHSWDRIAHAVAAAGYRTVRPWLRGYHPDTEVPGRGYDSLTTAQDAIELLDALRIDRAVLVGHDWGASVTYAASTLAPQRFHAVVPIGIPHPSLLPRDLGMLWSARHFVAFKLPWAEAMTRRNDFAYLDTLYTRWSPKWVGPARDESLRNAKDCFRNPSSLTGALAYYRALTPNAPRELARPADVPALVVGGSEDIVRPELAEKTAQRMGTGSEALIIDGAGHWPHREGEDEFIARLITFLGAATG